MTTTRMLAIDERGKTVCIWPEQQSETDYEYEHAIVIRPYVGSVGLMQKDREINIPDYALDAVIKALREHQKVLKRRQG